VTALDSASAEPITPQPAASTACDECMGDGVVDAGRFSARHTRECWQCEGSGEVDCD
jgi:DnaJ-class molecular chaperone